MRIVRAATLLSGSQRWKGHRACKRLVGRGASEAGGQGRGALGPEHARETKYAGWSGRVCGGPQAATSFTPIQPLSF